MYVLYTKCKGQRSSWNLVLVPDDLSFLVDTNKTFIKQPQKQLHESILLIIMLAKVILILKKDVIMTSSTQVHILLT